MATWHDAPPVPWVVRLRRAPGGGWQAQGNWSATAAQGHSRSRGLVVVKALWNVIVARLLWGEGRFWRFWWR